VLLAIAIVADDNSVIGLGGVIETPARESSFR